MKAARFDYARARSLAHAVELLGSGDGFVKLLAGGQTLAPMLNLRLVRPDLLVDVSKLSEMTVWREEGGAILIGAGITHAAIEDGKLPGPTGRVLARIASGIAYRAAAASPMPTRRRTGSRRSPRWAPKSCCSAPPASGASRSRNSPRERLRR